MVFYFTSSVNSSAYTIYMGKDKYENEDLIKYGWPEDIWFHVDKLSSAHVYLRLHKGENIEDIPQDVLMDCAQLVKANSIQGCKMNNVNVVYTPWSNLKKTADMDVGQIGFHRQKDVKIVTVEKKVNEILNRLEKTKTERFPDLAAEKECRDREERNEKKAQIQEMKRREKEEMKKKREMDELRSYSSLMKAENMSSNQDVSCLLGLFLLPLARPSWPRPQLLLDHPPAQHGLHSTLDNEWLEFPGGFFGDPDCVMVPLVHPCCLLRGSSSQCHRLADTFLAYSASPARLALRVPFLSSP